MSEVKKNITETTSPFGGKGAKIVIAGGGTGGHIFPAVAIANAIKMQAPDTEFLFVGAKGKMEMEKVPQAGYQIKGLDIAGFNRSSLIKNIGLPFKLINSFFQVSQIFKSFRPDAVIGVGGYSTYPVLRYAQSRNIPTFIHESNSYPGKSNIMLGKKATKVFTASDNMERFFPAGKVKQTGNPVRQNISLSRITHEEGVSFFGLDPYKKTVLVFGGSLGAKSINEAIGNGIDAFADNGLQLIWQTGKPFFEQAKEIVKGRKSIFMSDFITEMDYAYAAADIIICRSGSTVYELCVIGKPAIVVPFPFAAEDHQTANAMALVNKDAAIMIRDSDTGKMLIPALLELINDEAKQKVMSKNIAALGITNADEVIAKEILNTIK